MRNEDIDPKLIESGVELLKTGQVTFEVSNGSQTQEVTEIVHDPLEAAHYALIQGGYTPEEIVLNHLKLKTTLNRSIQRRVKNWRQLQIERSDS